MPSTPTTLPQALLALLAESPSAHNDMTEGVVLNINIPPGDPEDMKGIKLTHQGTGCLFPCFKEIKEGQVRAVWLDFEQH